MEIEICKSCKGTGKIQGEDNNRGDWDYVTCICCHGTGRVITRSYKYTVPFDIDKSIVYKIDSEIVKLIRTLEQK